MGEVLYKRGAAFSSCPLDFSLTMSGAVFPFARLNWCALQLPALDAAQSSCQPSKCTVGEGAAIGKGGYGG